MKAVRGNEKPQKLIYAVALCYKTEPRSIDSAPSSGTGTGFVRVHKTNIQITNVWWAEKPELMGETLMSLCMIFSAGSFKNMKISRNLFHLSSSDPSALFAVV